MCHDIVNTHLFRVFVKWMISCHNRLRVIRFPHFLGGAMFFFSFLQFDADWMLALGAAVAVCVIAAVLLVFVVRFVFRPDEPIEEIKHPGIILDVQRLPTAVGSFEDSHGLHRVVDRYRILVGFDEQTEVVWADVLHSDPPTVSIPQPGEPVQVIVSLDRRGRIKNVGFKLAESPS